MKRAALPDIAALFGVPGAPEPTLTLLEPHHS